MPEAAFIAVTPTSDRSFEAQGDVHDEPVTELLSPSGPDDPPPARARRAPHWFSLVIFFVALALTFGLAYGAGSANNDNENRLLRLQVRQVAAALDSAVPSIQDPLIAADQLASTGISAAKLKVFLAPEVGPSGRFRTISLWKVSADRAVLVTYAGPRPELLRSRSGTDSFFKTIRPSPLLTVANKILTSPHRVLGFAEMLPGATNHLVVYAENHLPPRPLVVVKKSSPFSDLNFALYVGSRASTRGLLENTIPLPISGRRATAAVPFGDTVVTIVSTPAGSLSGLLPDNLPWLIAILGLLLAIGAALVSERLVRRREFAEALAEDNRRLYSEQRGIADSLQLALLPPGDPSFPGVELATRYVSGVKGLDIGGDWYDVIPLDQRRFFFVVGDVSGRGLKAATTMAYLQHAIKAYAIQGDGPERVLTKLDDLLNVRDDSCFATVFCALIDVPARKVTMCSAGHPAPLLIDDAGPRFIELPINPPVGVATGTLASGVTVDLAPRSSLMAFTDGLIERRGQPLNVGMEQLRRSVAAHPGSIDDVLSQVIADLLPDGSEDDLAILGVRWNA